MLKPNMTSWKCVRSMSKRNPSQDEILPELVELMGMERLKKKRRIASGGETAPPMPMKNFEALSIDTDKIVVLSWWNEMKAVFPILSQCAREVLSIPVSSSSSEHAFSFSGQVIVRLLLQEDVD